MNTVIHKPFWKTNGVFLYYGVLAIMLGFPAVCSWFIWRDRNLSREKIQLFMNTIRNPCMPLTLIKISLEYLYEKSSSELVNNVLQQVKDVNNLLADLESTSRTSASPGRLSLADRKLSTLLKETVNRLSSYTSEKCITLRRVDEPAFVTVRLDREKMAVILRDLLMAFTDNINRGREVLLNTSCDTQNWELKSESGDNELLKKKF